MRCSGAATYHANSRLNAALTAIATKMFCQNQVGRREARRDRKLPSSAATTA